MDPGIVLADLLQKTGYSGALSASDLSRDLAGDDELAALVAWLSAYTEEAGYVTGAEVEEYVCPGVYRDSVAARVYCSLAVLPFA